MNNINLHISKASLYYLTTRFEDWKKDILDNGKIWDSTPDFNLFILDKNKDELIYEDRHVGCYKIIDKWKDISAEKAIELLKDAEWKELENQ